MSTTTDRPSLQAANEARREADAERGRALAELSVGASHVADILRRAYLPEDRALRRIPLVRLLSGQEGTSKRQARAVIRQTLSLLEDRDRTEPQVDRITVMWVIDARAGGRRIRALADALDPKEQGPWKGFPYAVPSSRASNAGNKQSDRSGGTN